MRSLKRTVKASANALAKVLLIEGPVFLAALGAAAGLDDG